MRIKKLVKVGLSEGGGAQLNVLLKEGRGFCHECCCQKNVVSMRVLNLFEDLFVSCLNVLLRMGTKDSPLVRTDNSSSVNV